MIRIYNTYAAVLCLSLHLCLAADPEPVIGRKNLDLLIKDHQQIVLVSVYKEDWVPPVEGVEKGQLTYHARIVRVLRGRAQIGDKIKFHYNMENALNGRNSYEKSVDGKLMFLFFDADSMTKIEVGAYKLDEPNQAGCDFYRGGIEDLAKRIRQMNPPTN